MATEKLIHLTSKKEFQKRKSSFDNIKSYQLAMLKEFFIPAREMFKVAAPTEATAAELEQKQKYFMENLCKKN